MNTETEPRIAPDLIWRMLDDNAVVVSPRVGEVRVLNGVGTVIWQLLVACKSREEILSHLVANYQVTHVQAAADLDSFLLDLAEKGVVIWSVAPER